MWLSKSTDWGLSFTNATLWEHEPGTWGRNRLLEGLDGSLIFPIYNESHKELGHSYEHSQLLRKPVTQPVESHWEHWRMANTSYLVQPSVVRLKPGEPALRAYFRDRRAEWI